MDEDVLEYSSPECSRLSDLVLSELAGVGIASALVARADQRFQNVYQHIHSVSAFNAYAEPSAELVLSGYHENYYTPKQEKMFSREEIVDFLVTRQIFSGAGMFMGNGIIISPRALGFNKIIGGMMCKGDTPMMEVKGLHRLQVAIGEPNLSQIATMVKIGTTQLALQLLALDCQHQSTLYVEDAMRLLHQLNRFKGFDLVDHNAWDLAMEIQNKYLEAAKVEFAGRDEDTDWTLQKWAEALTAGSEGVDKMPNWVDWTFKRQIYQDLLTKGYSVSNIKRIDPELHRFQPELYELFKRKYNAESRDIYSQEAVCQAMNNPPDNTRASARGKVVRALVDHPEVISWKQTFNLPIPGSNGFDWHGLTVIARLARPRTINLSLSYPNNVHEKELSEFMRRLGLN